MVLFGKAFSTMANMFIFLLVFVNDKIVTMEDFGVVKFSSSLYTVFPGPELSLSEVFVV